jgi:hypothetical protein
MGPKEVPDTKLADGRLTVGHSIAPTQLKMGQIYVLQFTWGWC